MEKASVIVFFKNAKNSVKNRNLSSIKDSVDTFRECFWPSRSKTRLYVSALGNKSCKKVLKSTDAMSINRHTQICCCLVFTYMCVNHLDFLPC